MRWWSATCAVLAFAFTSGTARAQPAGGERDLAAEVRDVFARKCVGCHGADLPNPKGRFGYVLDLRKVAGNPEMVIRGRPDESELWVLVSRGEMPPPDSPTGALTAREKDTIRAWIAGGAPAGDESPAGPAAPPPARRALRWLGKFHLLVVHFPVALLVAATLGEMWSVWKGTPVPSPAVRFCVGLAAVTAVPAVVLGWLFALGGYGSSGLLALHRWVGTVAGAWVVVVAVSSEMDARRGARSWGTRVLLLTGVVLVGVTAHFGGLMVHGTDFFDW